MLSPSPRDPALDDALREALGRPQWSSDAVARLLDAGADPSTQSERMGYTVLMIAAAENDLPVLEKALALGADPLQEAGSSLWQVTALDFAAIEGRARALCLMLDERARARLGAEAVTGLLQQVVTNGVTRRRFSEVVELLEREGLGDAAFLEKLLAKTYVHGAPQIRALLLKQHPTLFGAKPLTLWLHDALAAGIDEPVTTVTPRYTPPVGVPPPPDAPETAKPWRRWAETSAPVPIQISLEPVPLETMVGDVRELLAKGADPNEPNATGETAMHLVALRGRHPEIDRVVALLVDHGGDPNVRTPRGVAPVHFAAEFGNVDVLRALVAHGADPHATDAVGRNSWAYAGALDYLDTTAVTEALEALGVERQRWRTEDRKSKRWWVVLGVGLVAALAAGMWWLLE